LQCWNEKNKNSVSGHFSGRPYCCTRLSHLFLLLYRRRSSTIYYIHAYCIYDIVNRHFFSDLCVFIPKGLCLFFSANTLQFIWYFLANYTLYCTICVIVCSIPRPHVWAALAIVRVIRFCETSLRYDIIYYDYMQENRSREGRTDREDLFPRPADDHRWFQTIFTNAAIPVSRRYIRYISHRFRRLVIFFM